VYVFFVNFVFKYTLAKTITKATTTKLIDARHRARTKSHWEKEIAGKMLSNQSKSISFKSKMRVNAPTKKSIKHFPCTLFIAKFKCTGAVTVAGARETQIIIKRSQSTCWKPARIVQLSVSIFSFCYCLRQLFTPQVGHRCYCVLFSFLFFLFFWYSFSPCDSSQIVIQFDSITMVLKQ